LRTILSSARAVPWNNLEARDFRFSQETFYMKLSLTGCPEVQ